MGFNSSILQPVSVTAGPIVSVAQFGAVGDGKSDDTAAIQSALNYIETHGGTLNFEAGHTYTVSKSLVIAGADDFAIDGNGATIKMADGTPVATGYSVLRIDTCDNFAVTDLTIDGNRANRSPAEVPAHNIIINGSHDFSFSDVKSLNAVADGFYLRASSPGDPSTHTENGLFLNCQADNGFRQGMSIINGENIQVIGGAYTNTNGTKPAAGIDVEANEGTAIPGNHNILIQGVTFTGNDGYGVQLSSKGLPTDITIEGCYFSDNDRGGIRLNTARTLIQGNTFEDFSQSERGLIDLGATQTNSDNVITENSFNSINTGQPVIFAHSLSGTNNQVYDNNYCDIDGPFLKSSTTGTTEWNNALTSTPSYPTGPTERPVDESLQGGAGDDTLDGGAGADTMQGGLGNDNYVVDAVGDVVTEPSKAGTDTVRSTISYTLGANMENLVLLAASTALVATGNSLANELSGNDQDNIIDGKAGADTMIGGVGNDLYIVDNVGDLVVETGGDGKDTVQSAVAFKNGFAGIEHYVFTGKSNVSFTAGDEDNAITTATGADTIDGGKGNDSMAGGAGNDTYVADSSDDEVTEAAKGGTDTVKSSASFVLGDFVEKLELTGGGDIDGTGNGLANTITGNTGANELFGLAGNDTLTGGDGSDTLDGGDSNDAMAGGGGNDLYIVGIAGDKVTENSAAGGEDTVESAVTYVLGKYVEDLKLTAGNTNGTGNTDDNLIVGSDGDNILDGKAGADTLRGGKGNDTYVVDGFDTVDEVGGDGQDTLKIAATFDLGAIAGIENLTLMGSGALNGTGTDAANVLVGNSGANNLAGLGDGDSLAGGAGNDTLDGGSGNDTVDGGAGADNLTGGAGNDTYGVDSAKDVVNEVAGDSDDLISASITIDLANYAEIENVTLTGISALKATGDEQGNELTGNDGANLLTGLGGDDALAGGKGNDTLDGSVDGAADALAGGLGNDTYLIGELGETVTEAASEGTDVVRSAVSHTLAANVENLILLAGAAGAIQGIGNGEKNAITGNELANTLDGGLLVDTLIGGKGDDTYLVDETKDVVTETTGKDSGNDTVISTAAAYTLGVYVENLTLDTGSISGTGNTLNNILTGNDGDNTLNGAGGADTMNGGLGNDTYVYDGKDAIDDAGGFDVVQAAIAIDLTLPTPALEDIEGVRLTGTGALSATGDENANLLIGNAGANKLTGNQGADTIEGAGGNDTINGGGGDDKITGGAGADRIDVADGNDTVFYTSKLDGKDIIDNFSAGQDVLDLDALFDSLSVASDLRDDRVALADKGVSVEVRVDADGKASNGAELFVAVLNTADDIVLNTDVVVGTL